MVSFDCNEDGILVPGPHRASLAGPCGSTGNRQPDGWERPPGPSPARSGAPSAPAGSSRGGCRACSRPAPRHAARSRGRAAGPFRRMRTGQERMQGGDGPPAAGGRHGRELSCGPDIAKEQWAPSPRTPEPATLSVNPRLRQRRGSKSDPCDARVWRPRSCRYVP